MGEHLRGFPNLGNPKIQKTVTGFSARWGRVALNLRGMEKLFPKDIFHQTFGKRIYHVFTRQIFEFDNFQQQMSRFFSIFACKCRISWFFQNIEKWVTRRVSHVPWNKTDDSCVLWHKIDFKCNYDHFPEGFTKKKLFKIVFERFDMWLSQKCIHTKLRKTIFNFWVLVHFLAFPSYI